MKFVLSPLNFEHKEICLCLELDFLINWRFAGGIHKSKRDPIDLNVWQIGTLPSTALDKILTPSLNIIIDVLNSAMVVQHSNSGLYNAMQL